MSFKVKEKNFVSIVVHVKDNVEGLVTFIEKVNPLFKENFDAFEYIVVNNNPNHDSVDVISEGFIDQIKKAIKIINLSWSHNIEDAMRAGVELAIGDFVFEFDSVHIDFDLQVILGVYFKALEGYDVVASEPDSKASKRSKQFYKLLNRLSDRNIELTTETFRIVSRRMLNRLSNRESFRYRKINYHYSGLKTKIVKYSVISKDNIEDGFTLGERVSLGANILIYYSNIGTKISLMLSLSFLTISIIVIAFTFFSYFTKPDSIQAGWTTTMLFLSISFCGIFAILAVLSKYMEVLLREAQIKKAYSFKSIDHIS